MYLINVTVHLKDRVIERVFRASDVGAAMDQALIKYPEASSVSTSMEGARFSV